MYTAIGKARNIRIIHGNITHSHSISVATTLMKQATIPPAVAVFIPPLIFDLPKKLYLNHADLIRIHACFTLPSPAALYFWRRFHPVQRARTSLNDIQRNPPETSAETRLGRKIFRPYC